jgi:hypothetical protein
VRPYWNAHRERVLAIAAVLADPRLDFGVLPQEGDFGVPECQRHLVDVGLALQLGARCADDPVPCLAGLDGLLRAMQPARTRLQGMLTIELARLRDQAYLTAVLLGRLDPERAARWRAEPANQRLLLASGLEGERAHLTIPALRPLSERGLWETLGQVGAGGSLWSRWRAWCNQPAVAATVIAAQRAGAAGLRGDPSWSWEDRDEHGSSGSFALFMVANAALTAETFHRLARLAAVVVDWQRGHGELPASSADLARIAPELGAGGRLRLLYERLGATRFRIVIDPAGTLPPFADAQRYAPRTWQDHPQGLYHYAVELDIPPLAASTPPMAAAATATGAVTAGP